MPEKLTKNPTKNWLAYFCRFIFKPRSFNEFAEQVLSWKEKVWLLVQAVCSSLVVATIAGTFGFFLVNRLTGISNQTNTLLAYLGESSWWQTIFLVAFFGPLIEEIIFRSWLKPSKISLMCSGYLLFQLLVANLLGMFVIESPSLLLGLNLILPLVLVLALFQFIRTSGLPKIQSFLEKHFPHFFYFSVIAFALAHLSNWENWQQNWLLLVPLVLPQLMSGLFFTFLRLSIGFWWGFGAHSLYNFIILTPILFLGLNVGGMEELLAKPVFSTASLLAFALYLSIFAIFIFTLVHSFQLQEAEELPLAEANYS